MCSRPRIFVAAPVDWRGCWCGVRFSNKPNITCICNIINNWATKCILPHNGQNGGDVFLDILLELWWRRCEGGDGGGVLDSNNLAELFGAWLADYLRGDFAAFFLVAFCREILCSVIRCEIVSCSIACCVVALGEVIRCFQV